MSSLSLLPTSLLESLGLGLLQKAADAALGPGVLTISSDSNGMSAGLTLSSGQTINIDDLTVNAQGLSGRLFVGGLDNNPLSATLYDGFAVALTAFDITLAHGGLAASHIGGSLTIPFFTDSNGNLQTVDIEISTKSDGSLSITLAAESTQDTTPDGLIQLKYELASVGSVEIDVASLEINEANNTWSLLISGNLIVETAGLSWPSIELTGLGIDSKGNISLQGGWIDLPNQMALDFYGFHVALEKLGFGSDANGDKWVGFNGDIHLVEGISLGGSVRGLQINLTHPSVSLDGVSISFEIPDVLTIDGEIDHFQVNAFSPQDLVNAGLPGYIFDFIAPIGPAPSGGKQVNVFAGQVDLVINAADDLEVDANFIVGTFGGQSVFFLDIDAELPFGIPIFTDISLYGLQGLVATGLQPDPEPTYTWWQWYKYPAAGEDGSGTTTGSTDLNAQPDYSATDFYKWLVPSSGAFAIGAGATIGTAADDGYTVSAAIMFVLMLPGPIISLVGKANILSQRVGGASQDADFEAMATYDGDSQTFDLTVDAQYSIPEVLDIEAPAELYVDAPSGIWYFALGKPPHEKRVQARIFDIFEADSYFVVSNTGLVMGSWTGYDASWSFGPLSVSLDAYLATLGAIQWSPLQIAAGVELYGNLQLSAFGINAGLTADALLEGCAPNPFWIYGEISVELDLPWPLPNIGANISLSWGGDDGSVPPAPLALSHVDATLADHCDSGDKQASDHYVLLAHRTPAIAPDLTVIYDPVTPGILGLTATTGRTPNSLPDLIPDNTSQKQMAPVLPQDAHFTLNFAHATVDGTGVFDGAIAWGNGFPQDVPVPSLPPANLIGADDMSNINPTPPAIAFVIRHTLVEVSLFQFQAGAWKLVCSTTTPANPNPAIGVTQLGGVWLSPEVSGANPSPQAMTQLKVFPWRFLPGQSHTAQWTSQSPRQPYGTSFTDQDLQFNLAAGIEPAVIGNLGFSFLGQGLSCSVDGSQKSPIVTIRFLQPSILVSITALVYAGDADAKSADTKEATPAVSAPYVPAFNPPQCFGDGSLLTPQSSSQDASAKFWTLTFENNPAVQELTIPIAGIAMILYAIDYSGAPIPMAILPGAPAFYAVSSVTKIEAERVGSPNFQAVPYGDPVVEFVYFQTAGGPGTVQGTVATPPIPSVAVPYPKLQQNCSTAQQPLRAFPLGGALADLHTYTQWSWPMDGATTAYYSYDVNIEFVETYVNALYSYLANNSDIPNSLHFRCVDRNNRHTLFVPNAIHVPSISQQSALVAAVVTPQLPKALQPPPVNITVISKPATVELQKRAMIVSDLEAAPDAAPDWAQPPLGTLLRQTTIGARNSGLAIQQINPNLAAEILQQIVEYNSAQQAKDLWFSPLLPTTRYTLDVVAGPLVLSSDGKDNSISPGSLSAIFSAPDAIGALAALQAYYEYEDSLTTLQRVQFTTSRYATFTAQMTNAMNQLAAAPGATPIRNYAAEINPVTWLGTVSTQVATYMENLAAYLSDHDSLSSLVEGFDPLADDRQPTSMPATNGAGALVQQRQKVEADWTAFGQSANNLYDGLITVLGHPEMASRATPIGVPDTEISLFTDTSGAWVEAILIESPEPLPWLRTCRWITLSDATNHSLDLLVVWSADGTRGLFVPLESGNGNHSLSMIFQGNIGAEAPCITRNGNSVKEPVLVGSIRMGPTFISRHPDSHTDQKGLDQAPANVARK
jgi:hypothetical protein